MESLPLLKECLKRVRQDADFHAFVKALHENNVAYYVYFVATGNITFVKENDDFVPLKSDRYLLKINANASEPLIRIISERHFSGKLSYERYCSELARAGVFRWIVDLNCRTRSYYSRKNELICTEPLFPVETTWSTHQPWT